ncbi:MAG: hypothetical protein JWP89_1195 [Schlesneria sp.]|nr:hypothetical protein [Schlesneria sp.]
MQSCILNDRRSATPLTDANMKTLRHVPDEINHDDEGERVSSDCDRKNSSRLIFGLSQRSMSISIRLWLKANSRYGKSS